MEEWRQIKDFPKYAVSNLGNIKNLKTGRILLPSKNKGYYKVFIRHNGIGKTVFIHKAASQAFIGECPTGKEINHIDLNKLNNFPENLEYITPDQNRRHWQKNKEQPFFLREPKLTNEDVKEIRKLRATGQKLIPIAKKFNVSFGHVWKICVGMRRQWL